MPKINKVPSSGSKGGSIYINASVMRKYGFEIDDHVEFYDSNRPNECILRKIDVEGGK